jgi:glycosyltransferase involved in cell wall biosynthesis
VSTRILVVMRSGEWRGGAEWSLFQWLQAGVADPRLDVTAVFLEDGGLARDVAGLGVRTHVMPAGPLRDVRRWARTVARLRQLLRQERTHLVLSWMADAHLYAGVAARLAGVRATFYQMWVPAPSWVDRVATAVPGVSSTAIVAMSRTIAAAQQRIRPKREVVTVYAGVDLSRFDRARLPGREVARRRLGLPQDRTLIGFVGRLEPWKGPQTLVEALPTVSARHPEAHVVLVGSEHPKVPGFRARLEARAAALGLADTITFAGEQSEPELWMAAFDVFVHASDTEPFGIVVVEAMGVGLPVVAGDAGGPSEVIRDGESGLLTAFEDGPALARALNRLLDDPAHAARLGAAAVERAAEFSTAAYTAHLTDVLIEQASSPRELERTR